MQWEAKTLQQIFCGKFKHISRFSVVGVLNTLVDFLVFTCVHEIFGLGYLISQTAGYGFGILNSFILNKNWTFNEKSNHKKKIEEFIEFAAVNLITLFITLITMKFLVQNTSINLYMSKIIVTFIAQFTNFILYRFWVFY